MVKTWGTVFSRYKRAGMDASDAAFRADEWEARQCSKVDISDAMMEAFISAGSVAEGLRAVILIDRCGRPGGD